MDLHLIDVRIKITGERCIMKISVGDRVRVLQNVYLPEDVDYTPQAYCTKGSVGTVLSMGMLLPDHHMPLCRIRLEFVAPNSDTSDGEEYHKAGDDIYLSEGFLELIV
jgi:hypothetical protein